MKMIRTLCKVCLAFGTFVLVMAPMGISQTCTVTVSPNAVTVLAGGAQQFQATVVPSSCSRNVKWRASAGTINSSGLFSAPVSTTQMTVTVYARQAKSPGAVGSASVTITPITSIAVTPASASILAGDT